MDSDSLQSQLNQGLLLKHPEFWFSDGSLILRAHSTLFRVHISQLCRKSVFFRDLFSLPQPPESDPTERQLEGCPVLDLHDSPEDVANLVKVIYDGPYVFNPFLPLLFLVVQPRFVFGFASLRTRRLGHAPYRKMGRQRMWETCPKRLVPFVGGGLSATRHPSSLRNHDTWTPLFKASSPPALLAGYMCAPHALDARWW